MRSRYARVELRSRCGLSFARRSTRARITTKSSRHSSGSTADSSFWARRSTKASTASPGCFHTPSPVRECCSLVLSPRAGPAARLRRPIHSRPSIPTSKSVSTMSSGTSTETRLKPDTTTVQPKPDPGLQPWQFFVLAALGCATAVTFIARGQGVIPVVLLGVLMASTALVGIAALRTVRPLVSPEDDRTSMIGHRTRAALEREKMLALRSIKELEFDRAMGKLSDADFQEMSGRLRARAARLMRQLDAGAGYREQIERDLAKRLGQTPGPNDPAYTLSEQTPAYTTSVRRAGP